MRNNQTLILIILIIALTGCSTIKVPDVPICRPLRMKTEVKNIKGLGEVKLTRGNPLCLKETGAGACLYCTTIGTGQETYVSDDPKHLIRIGNKLKSYSILMNEGSILPVESWTELRDTFINSCKQFGCTEKDISNWRIKAVRFTSIGEALK